jgi:hypothetical protein
MIYLRANSQVNSGWNDKDPMGGGDTFVHYCRCSVIHRLIEHFKRYNFSSGHTGQFIFWKWQSDNFGVASARASIEESPYRNPKLISDLRVRRPKESSSIDSFSLKWLGRRNQSTLREVPKHWVSSETTRNRVRKHDYTISSRIHRNITGNYIKTSLFVQNDECLPQSDEILFFSGFSDYFRSKSVFQSLHRVSRFKWPTLLRPNQATLDLHFYAYKYRKLY